MVLVLKGYMGYWYKRVKGGTGTKGLKEVLVLKDYRWYWY